MAVVRILSTVETYGLDVGDIADVDNTGEFAALITRGDWIIIFAVPGAATQTYKLLPGNPGVGPAASLINIYQGPQGPQGIQGEAGLPTGGLSRRDEHVIQWESGDQTSKLDADIAMTSAPADTVALGGFERQIIGADSTSLAGRLRITTPAGLAGGGQRNFIPITGSDCINSEIRSLWYGKSGLGSNGQCGHVHRIQSNGSGRQRGYIVWNDAIASTESILDTGWWDGQAPTGGNNAEMIIHFSTNTKFTPSDEIEGLKPNFPVVAASHNGTTVCVITRIPHTAQVGDFVKLWQSELFDGASYNAERSGEIGVVTAITSNTVTYTSSINYGFVPNYAAAGVDSKLLILSRVMPYWVCSQLIGTTLRAKAWPQGVGEPNWGDPKYTLRESTYDATPPPATSGKCGIYAGHLAAHNTNFQDYGAVTWKILD